MARCISCGTEIPDGAEYCEECLSKLNTAKNSESYLDSLLSAVMTEEPERREIVYPKKETSSLVSMPETKESEVSVKEPEESEDEVWDDFLQDFMSAPEEVEEEKPGLFTEEVPEESPMEDVFGTFFDATTELPDLKNYSIFEDVDEGTVDRMLAEELGDMPTWEEEIPSEEEEPEETLPEEEMPMFFGEEEEEPAEEIEEEVPMSEVSDIEDLFGMLEDERGADAPKELEMKTPETISAADFNEAEDMFSGIVETPEEVPVTEFGDFADLFGGSEEEPVVEEVPATEFGDFADLFGGSEEEAAAEEVPVKEFGDFSDLFGSDEKTETKEQASSVELDDMADLFGGMFEFGAEPEVLEEESETTTGGAQTGTVSASQNVSGNAKKDEKKEKTPGRLATLYHKLFDNVKVDPSKIKPQPTKEELEAAKQKKEEEKARSKEEKEALLADKKEQQRQVKLEKQRIKNEKKAQKKAKKLEEAKLLLEEMESTRINRAGATIVFIFFAMVAMAVIVGTGIVSYSISIQNAEREFNRDEYTLAYNEIYGLEIKDEDILLYDRIMTVMYVQKQLNSYENYYGMNDMPRALDSLLKGLQRYEKYIELAVELDVDTDLDSVRKKILEKVSASFMLTEQEAMEIIQSDSQVEYSTKVYDAIDGLE